ncbi:hypothetical protein RclHR1_00060010 [Rhizophagus clarus]|uniref:F-box domain-containing protein n=1 Tax=Rhizophagus clarus TaxID=94130 RepID=A0A2Z6SH34_9GLOM|nr:hypothetical protein RclHR1_00060010 [Rhizophagus clarus]
MSKLNRDILYLIFEKLHDDKNTLYTSLLVNKTWCETIIPILWRNPWKYLTPRSENLLYNVIISHLSDELKNNLKFYGIDFSTSLYKKLLFNYFSFCKHLDLVAISRIMYMNSNMSMNSSYLTQVCYSKCKSTKLSVVMEILKAFINVDTKFTHLYLPQDSESQVHLIPEAKHSLSEIVFLSCYTLINDEIITGLTEICHSIEVLEIFVEKKDTNYGITKLIEASKKLVDVRLIIDNKIFFSDPTINNSDIDELCKVLENSLMKHAHTIQYFKITSPPTTKILSSLVNLKGLELNFRNRSIQMNNLEDIFLINLRILKSRNFQTNILRSLIVNTNGSLTEISIDDTFNNEVDNKSIIQAIYQNCPNLQYLKLMFRNENVLELEQLFICCKYLYGIYFLLTDVSSYLDKLFKILTESSPTNLFRFKFKIIPDELINLESLKLFFDNWKGRNSMLLQFELYGSVDLIDLIEEYESIGIIKEFNELNRYNTFKDFEW